MSFVRPGAFIVFGLLFGYPVLAQQLEAEPRPKGEARPEAYLASSPVDFRAVLGQPPTTDSIEDRADHQAIMEFQAVAAMRRKTAELDSDWVYPRFAEAFGGPIDRHASPALITLLNRAIRDVSNTTFAAKGQFHRPRPYQRFQLQQVCGEQAAPKPEPNPTQGSSYPSGHSAYGWAVAMILARVAPERSEVLMARAEEYAQSRLICGVHFPTDVEAGHTIAAAVVSRLDGSADFQADLARARAEHTVPAKDLQ